MSWPEEHLSALITIKHGFAFKSEFFRDDGCSVVVTPGNFLEAGGFKSKGRKEKFYDGPVPQDFVLKPGQVIVAMTEQGEGLLGSAAIVPAGKRYLHNQRIGLVNAISNDFFDLKYAYYVLNSKPVRQKIRASCTGTKVRHTSPANIGAVKVCVPPLPTQRRIAGILSAYDDLIENNTRRIVILEDMARRLFEEWFVHFRFPGGNGEVPKGWTSTVFGELLTQSRRKTKAGEHLSSRLYVPIECIGRRTLHLPEARSWEDAQSSLQLFDKGDILFGAMRAYFHKVCVAPDDGVTRTTCFVLTPKEERWRSFATMIAFSDKTVNYAAAHSKGSTIPYAHWDGSLANMAVNLPTEDLLNKFETAVSPMVAMVQSFFAEQLNLRVARDLLLLKLISGEINVSSVEAADLPGLALAAG